MIEKNLERLNLLREYLHQVTKASYIWALKSVALEFNIEIDDLEDRVDRVVTETLENAVDVNEPIKILKKAFPEVAEFINEEALKPPEFDKSMFL